MICPPPPSAGGDWKLIQFDGKPLCLYNLAEDPAEQHNLTSSEPEKTRELERKLDTWEKATVPPGWRGESASLLNGIRKTHRP